MKEKILITIVGAQKIDDQDDKVELTTVGSIEKESADYLIKYKEQQEPPLRPINVSIKVAKDSSRVEVIRSGDINSCLIVEKSKRNLCHYGTMYGDVLMGIFGKNIEFTKGKDSGCLELEYDIDINGALTSMNTLTLNFSNN